MNEQSKPVTFEQAAMYAVNALADFCTQMGKDGVPREIIVYALAINHAMAMRMILEGSFTALKAEGSNPSESPQGG